MPSDPGLNGNKDELGTRLSKDFGTYMMRSIKFQAVQLRDFTPGVTAIQVRLHPLELPLSSVWKNISTVFVLVVIVGGWKYQPPLDSAFCKFSFSEYAFPQLLSIKVVPSPSVTLI